MRKRRRETRETMEVVFIDDKTVLIDDTTENVYEWLSLYQMP